MRIDRRQEAIKELIEMEVTVVVPGWEESGAPGHAYHTGRLTEDSVSRISTCLAPLREFPERQIEDILSPYFPDAHRFDECVDKLRHFWQGQLPLMVREFPRNDVAAAIIHSIPILSTAPKRLLDWIERLWHGQEAKGGCPTCEGAGTTGEPEFAYTGGQSGGDVYQKKLCPDCKGTGDRRSKEEWPNTGRRRQRPIILEFAGTRIYYLDPCMAAYTDHRSGEVRRK